MNTNTHFSLKNSIIDVDEFLLSEMTDDNRKNFKHYVEITRHIIELNKLFHIFRCNLDILLHHFQLNTNGLIVSKVVTENQESDYIQINSFTINFISSAKSLLESIEAFMKTNSSSETFKLFKEKYLSKTYDNCFSYRLLLHLRNFAQHGHLPVSIDNKRVYFDLYEILNVPHFDLNKNLSKEIAELEKDIYDKYGDLPHISYTFTIAEFNVEVTKVYCDFLNASKSLLNDSITKINTLLKEKPYFVISDQNSPFKGMVLFDYDDNQTVHFFDSKVNIMKNFYEFKKEALRIKKNEEYMLTEIKKELKR